MKRFLLLFGIVFILFYLSIVFAQTNVCCEKTNNGAWCQNTQENKCDISVNSETGSNYRKSPTSCESTSFCRLGCCVDSSEGLCMENTPQVVCDEANGVWNDDSQCNVAQCDLGCCILGDQASFVTLTRCKKLSSNFGLDTDFRREIGDEASCIAIAHASDKGACVFDTDGQRTCKFETRAECNVMEDSDFFKDFLCSADELATNCGPTTETICVDGKDEVFFKDSCGNPANIYDSGKTYNRDSSYWQKVVPKSGSCGINDNDGNANSKSCGNCEYFKGSICGEGDANVGNYICKDLNCYDTNNGKDYENGESWCVFQANAGEGRDPVGSRHFRHICINGEEIVEACADFRNERCIQADIKTTEGTFTEAACRVNRWEDCIDQSDRDDCLNGDKRDCHWSGSECFPDVPPGLNFWNDGQSAAVCSVANVECTPVFEKDIFGSDIEDLFGDLLKDKCVENCECLEQGWARERNNVCASVGDCGAYVNIAGGYTAGGAEWKINGEKKIIEGLLNVVRARAGV